jgi:hypothetical protein
MKFLKKQTLSKYIPNDLSLEVNPSGRAQFGLTGGLMLPKGDDNARPVTSGVRQNTDANGTIRYNTDTESIEAYIADNWQVVTAPAATSVTLQTLGPGDAIETVFGPLSRVPSNANNIIVLVENVFQLPSTNFTLEQSVAGNLTGPNAPYADGFYLKFLSPVPFGKFVSIYFGFV